RNVFCATNPTFVNPVGWQSSFSVIGLQLELVLAVGTNCFLQRTCPLTSGICSSWLRGCLMKSRKSTAKPKERSLRNTQTHSSTAS
ncbi:hypothetical protein V5799_030837, partial [Amblyomma americanum]